ncbi:MAG: hypothetical protein ABIC18_00235 [Candidatus Omnitrophota bacterium]
MIKLVLEKIKEIAIAIAKGFLGIVTELGYALAIMAAAFFICVLLTSF